MATDKNLPFVMTCDAVESPVEDETVHIKVPFKVENKDDEPRGDDAGEGEPTSQQQTVEDAAPIPPGVRHNGKIVHVVRRVRIVPEKVKDEDKDSLAKDEAIATDADISTKRKVATSAEDCKAENKFRCPYHGAAAMSSAFEDILKKHGLGDMKFSISPEDDSDEDDLSYILDFECPEEFVDTHGLDVLKEFGRLEGVKIETEDTEGLLDKIAEGKRRALFEVDFFDKDLDEPKEEATTKEEAKEEPKEEPEKKKEEPPKTEKEEDYSPADDFEEDTKTPTEEFKEDTLTPKSTAKKDEESSDDIPKSPVDLAMKTFSEFGDLIPDSRMKEIEESINACNECAKDIDSLEGFIKDAPNDRVRKLLKGKLDAALKRMDICQEEVKHACGDMLKEIKSSINKKVEDAGLYDCALKMSFWRGSDIEFKDLKEDARLTSLSRIKGYKELKKAEEKFIKERDSYNNLVSDFREADGVDDYSRMAKIGEELKQHIKKCNIATDELKLASDNMKASLVKSIEAKRKKKFDAAPEHMKSISPLVGEDFKAYSDRLKKLGIKVPTSLDCGDYVNSDEYVEYCKSVGVSEKEIEINRKHSINNTEHKDGGWMTYGEREKILKEKLMNQYGWDEAKWNKECKILTDHMTKILSKGKYGMRIHANALNIVLGGSTLKGRDHFMNQMESGSSHGSPFSTKGIDNATKYNTRGIFSHQKYGGAYHMPPDKYEKYGCLGDDTHDINKDEASDRADQYGEIFVKFKKDKVCATITYGDSGWSWEATKPYCPPLTTHITPGIANDSNYDSMKSTILKSSTPGELVRNSGKYIELHYHNENMNASVIEEINLPKYAFAGLNKKARDTIRKYGIPVYVDGELTEV